MQSGLKGVVFLLPAFLLAPILGGSGQPSVHATVSAPAAGKDITIQVTAADTIGLDSLTIDWLEGDLSYHTELPHSTADRSFQRTYRLHDLFPTAVDAKRRLHLNIEVRNTRGATASTAVSIDTRPQKLN